ncbi:putative UbiX-like flavin prenyltransferase [Sporomusa carbonis]|uniref:UbiX family flavin prenyltransferase n=1 Tax=Sporomusa carbonis TaxID=3076075 RepID=UPI003A6C073A
MLIRTTGSERAAVPRRLVVGISGASGAPIAIELLQEMKNFPEWETHVVISSAAEYTIKSETDYSLAEVQELATKVYSPQDIGGAIASGTYKTDGMVVVPCSMKTLAAIANGHADNLLARAADVTIKEQRKLVLVTREAPLSPIHLNNMLTLARLGIVILPPVLTFYNQATTVADMVRHIVGKILGNFGLDIAGFKRWGEDQ